MSSTQADVAGAGAVAVRLGAIRERSLLAEPSTPAYRTVWKRGGGTDATSLLSRESGSMSTATVPSENAFLRAMRTSPSAPRVTRSCATAGRRMYLRSASRPCSSSPPARVAACSVNPSSATQSGRSNTIARCTTGSAPRRHSGPAGGVAPETADAASRSSTAATSRVVRRRRALNASSSPSSFLLHRNHRAALSAPADDAALAVEVEDGLDEEARQRREKRSVVAEALAPRERHREHPLAKRDGERQDVLDEMRRGRRHLPPKARRTEPAALAAERHQPRLLAAITPKAPEATAEQPAVEIALELLPHEPRQRDRERTVVHRAVERREVVRHHLIERRLFRSATLIDHRRRQHVGGLRRPRASPWPPSSAPTIPLRTPPFDPSRRRRVFAFKRPTRQADGTSSSSDGPGARSSRTAAATLQVVLSLQRDRTAARSQAILARRSLRAVYISQNFAATVLLSMVPFPA